MRKPFEVGWRLLLAVLLAVALGAGLWAAGRRAGAWLIPALERELARQTGLGVRIDGAACTGWPLSVRAQRVVLGEAGAPALAARALTVSLDARASLRQWHPVVAVSVAEVAFDASRLARPGASPVRGRTPGRSWLPSARVAVGHLRGSFGSGGRVREIELTAAELEVAVRESGIRLFAHAARGRVWRESAALAFGETAVALRAVGRRWFVEHASVHGDALSALVRAERAGAARFEARVALAPLQAVLGIGVKLAGTLRARGRLAGDLARPKLAFDAVGSDLSAANWRAMRARARGVLTAARLEVRELEAEIGDVGIRGRAKVEFREMYPAEAELALRAEKVSAGGFGDLRWGLASAGNMVLRGSLSPFRGEGHLAVQVRDLRAGGFQGAGLEGEARAEGAFSGEELRVAARAALGKSVNIEGSLAVAGADVRGEARLRVASASELQPLWPGLTGGEIAAHGSVRGTKQHPELEFHLAASDLIAAAHRVDSVEARGVLTRARVTGLRAEVRAAQGRFALRGEVAVDRRGGNAFEVEAQRLDLGALASFARSLGMPLPDLRGGLNGRARVRGSWEVPAFEGEAEARPLVVGSEKLERVAARADLGAARWRAELDIARAANETARVEGTGVGAAQWLVRATSTPWALGGFRFLRPLKGEIGGTLEVSADVRGSPRTPEGQIRFALRDVVLGGRALGDVAATATAARGRWRFAGSSADGRVAWEGEIVPKGPFPFSVEATGAAVDFSPWLARGADVHVVADARMRAAGNLAGGAQALGGELVLSRVEVRRDAQRLATEAPVVVRGQKGQFEIEPFELRGELGTVAAAGSFAADGALDIRARCQIDARVLELAGEPVTSAKGSVRADASIRRRASGQWELSGGGEVKDLALDLGLPFAISDANGTFRLAENRVEIVDMRGRAGGGDVVLAGAAVLGVGPALQWQAMEVSTGLIEDVEDRVSGAGEITGTWHSPVVRGDVTVISALYQRSVELADLVTVFRHKVRRRAISPKAVPVGLDVYVHASDSLYVDTDIAQAEFRADLHVTGTTAAPLLEGRMELLAGSVRVGSTELTVSEGLVIFRREEEIDPELRFTASGPVRRQDAVYDVVARVTGTLREYRVALGTEEGGLSQRDVLSLLATGRATAELEGPRGSLARDIVMLAPSLYGRGVTRELKRVLPVDRLEIQPAFSRTTGAFEPRVSVGKDITERLRASVGSTFGVQAKNDVWLEYDLLPWVTLEGSWESRTESSEGAFGGDIKFRREFRRLSGFSLLP